MLIVKIELHSAVTGEVSEIAHMRIINDGTGTRDLGNYDVELMEGRKDGRRVAMKSRVEGYPRLPYTVWELVRRALGGRGSTPFVPVNPDGSSPRALGGRGSTPFTPGESV